MILECSRGQNQRWSKNSKNRIKIVLRGNLIKALLFSDTNFVSLFFSFFDLDGMARLETNFNKKSKAFSFFVFFLLLKSFFQNFKRFYEPARESLELKFHFSP
jgi:hypothetical protein